MSISKDIIETLEYIEKNLKEELSAELLSSRINYSKFHFSRVFIFYVGTSVMDYIVTRRVIHIAYEINSGKKPSDILYDYLFETQTGFNKAFKKRFGMTPKKFNKELSISIPSLIVKDMIDKNIKGGILMEPKIISKEPITIAGYKITTKNIDSQNNRDIPKFWKEYMSDGRMEELHSEKFVKNHTEYGACVNVQSDGYFEYMIAVEINEEEVSSKYSKYVLKEQTYAVFTTPKADSSDLDNKIQYTWNFIFEKWLPNSPYIYDTNGVDFELYDERCLDDENKIIDIYIPVKKK